MKEVKKIKEKYQNWIDQNVMVARNNCEFFSKEITKTFPELTLVRGHYYDPLGYVTEHWWTKDKKGKIVDPTAEQFAGPKIIEMYEEWDESQPEPVGICANCGKHVFFPNNTVCSEKCHKEYLAYITGAI